MSWNVDTVAEQIVTLFEGISTSNTLDSIAYNTSPAHVYRVFKRIEEVDGAYNLAIAQENEIEIAPKDVNWTSYKTFVDFTLFGYVQGQEGKDATTNLSYLKQNIGKLIQDCSRVLLANAIANVNTEPRWILSAKDEYERNLSLKFYAGYEVEKCQAIFSCPFKVQILWHGRTLA